jgi:cytidyltransferase-like protein
MNIGLVLGRFQPLHYGHITLFEQSLRENDETIICIGSAQQEFPLSIAQRHDRVEKQLEILGARCRIVDFVDDYPWPDKVAQACGLTNASRNTLYRADDDISFAEKQQLLEYGIQVKLVSRDPFPYRAPNGLYYKVSSATQIRAIHQALHLESLL